MRVIRITTNYNEQFLCIEKKRDSYYVYTDKGNIPINDIKYIDIIGDVIESEEVFKDEK